ELLFDEGKTGCFGKPQRLAGHAGLPVMQHPNDGRLAWNGCSRITEVLQRDHRPGLGKPKVPGKPVKAGSTVQANGASRVWRILRCSGGGAAPALRQTRP